MEKPTATRLARQLHWGGFILKQTPMRRLAEDVRSRTTVANSNPEDFRAANFRTEGDRKETNRTEINHADEKLDILSQVRIETFAEPEKLPREFTQVYPPAYPNLVPERVSTGDKFIMYGVNSLAFAHFVRIGAEVFTSRPQVKAAAFMFGAAWGGINGSYMLKGREAELLSRRQIGSSTRQISSSTP